MNTLRLVGSRWTAWLLWTLFVLTLLIAIVSAVGIWRATTLEKAVQDVRGGAPLQADAGPAQKVARAVWLSSQDESEKALSLYQDVETGGHDAHTTRVAQFNSANQYMRDARRLIESESAGRAAPLIELAKQIYRSLLVQEPDNWAVRYNLTRALVMLPDPPPEPESSGPRPDAERAITTVRGYSPGMP